MDKLVLGRTKGQWQMVIDQAKSDIYRFEERRNSALASGSGLEAEEALKELNIAKGTLTAAEQAMAQFDGAPTPLVGNQLAVGEPEPASNSSMPSMPDGWDEIDEGDYQRHWDGDPDELS